MACRGGTPFCLQKRWRAYRKAKVVRYTAPPGKPQIVDRPQLSRGSLADLRSVAARREAERMILLYKWASSAI
jgi:hypothetical protein